MKYFVTAKERKASGSTAYHEFFRGLWNIECGFWNDNSLYIEDSVAVSTGLIKFLFRNADSYDPYGCETKISKGKWEELYGKAKEEGGCLFDAISEMDPWAEEVYRNGYPVITILGL